MANQLGDTQMKLTKLLTGAAIAALLTGAANAQVVITEGNFDGVVDVATTEIDAAEEIFASQVNYASLRPAFNGEFQVNVTDIANPGTVGGFDTLGAADQFDVTITLTGGLYFDAAINNSNFVGDEIGSTCTLLVASGGAAGSQSVTYRLEAGDNPAQCDDNATDLEFDLPIEVRGAGNIQFASTAVGSGAALWSATYDGDAVEVGTQELVQLATGYTATFAADGTATTAASAVSTAGVAYDNLLGGGDTILGTLTFGNTGAQYTPGVDFTLATHAASGTLAVTLASDRTSLTAITCDGAGSGADNQAFGTGTATATCSTSGGSPALALADFADAAVITISAVFDADNSGTAISAQDVSAVFTPVGANANVTLTATSGALQRIARQGVTTPAFDWVGDASAVTRNIFRCTGVAASAQPFVNVSNSSAGINGTFPLTTTATNGEMIISNANIGAAAGAFGRGDVTFTFAGDTAVTCERLLVGNNGTLSELN